MPYHLGFNQHHHQNHLTLGKDRIISLADVIAGDEATVLAIHGERQVNSRLASLGLTPGVQVEMIRNYGHGPLIVTVRGAQVALGRGEASKIEVRRREHE